MIYQQKKGFLPTEVVKKEAFFSVVLFPYVEKI